MHPKETLCGDVGQMKLPQDTAQWIFCGPITVQKRFSKKSTTYMNNT
jgi:hypothetical protein